MATAGSRRSTTRPARLRAANVVVNMSRIDAESPFFHPACSYESQHGTIDLARCHTGYMDIGRLSDEMLAISGSANARVMVWCSVSRVYRDWKIQIISQDLQILRESPQISHQVLRDRCTAGIELSHVKVLRQLPGIQDRSRVKYSFDDRYQVGRVARFIEGSHNFLLPQVQMID